MTDTSSQNERVPVLRRIAAWFASADDSPELRLIRSRAAWARWQQNVREQKAAARARHAPIREIERRQTQTLHAALAANRQQGA